MTHAAPTVARERIHVTSAADPAGLFAQGLRDEVLWSSIEELDSVGTFQSLGTQHTCAVAVQANVSYSQEIEAGGPDANLAVV